MRIVRSIIDDVEWKQLAWYGHVQRMDRNRLPKQVTEWIPPGRRKSERSRRTWEMKGRKSISERNLADGQWNSRQEWQRVGQRRRTF